MKHKGEQRPVTQRNIERRYKREFVHLRSGNDPVKLRDYLVERYVASNRNGGPANFYALFGPSSLQRTVSRLSLNAQRCPYLIVPKVNRTQASLRQLLVGSDFAYSTIRACRVIALSKQAIPQSMKIFFLQSRNAVGSSIPSREDTIGTKTSSVAWMMSIADEMAKPTGEGTFTLPSPECMMSFADEMAKPTECDRSS